MVLVCGALISSWVGMNAKIDAAIRRGARKDKAKAGGPNRTEVAIAATGGRIDRAVARPRVFHREIRVSRAVPFL